MDVVDPAEKTAEQSQKCLLVSITNTITNITNHQLLTIKTIHFFSVVCYCYPFGFIGFNKPPIEGDLLDTHITFSIKTNTSPIITSKTLTNCVSIHKIHI